MVMVIHHYNSEQIHTLSHEMLFIPIDTFRHIYLLADICEKFKTDLRLHQEYYCIVTGVN